jgi:hypothetical protein
VTLTNDWRIDSIPGSGLRWTADRTNASTLIVEMVPNSTGRDVSVFTKSGKGKRAKDKAAFWKVGLDEKDANRHLRYVFEELE